METNKLYCGDNLTLIKDMPDNFVDLTVTSPPYDNLRQYNGYLWDFEGLAKELFRVTKSGGVVVWVVNDSTNDGCESLTSFKQAIFFVESCGFKLHDTMIYQKDGINGQYRYKYYPVFEYMFVFTKDYLKTFNPIKDRKNYSNHKKPGGRRQANGDLRKINKKIHDFEPFGKRYNVWFYDVGYMRTTTDTIAFQHPAVFPEELARDHILSWSNPNDIVFDLFAGSGTTLKMAKQTGRQYIGFEISKEYCEIAESRLKQEYLN